MYSYNQLEVILNYFEDSHLVEAVDVNLQQVFKGCRTIESAKAQLNFLGVESFSKDLWKVAKTLDWRKSNKLSKIESKGVEIQEGNIIKMGRLKMKLKKAELGNNNHKRKDNHNKNKNGNVEEIEDNEMPIDHNKDISFQVSDKTDDIPPCRFCLSNVMDDQNNPLINPCLCKGTQGLLHVECLKSWMSSKRSHKVFSPHSEMYTWKTMNCELCSAPYPFKICFNEQHVSLLDYDEPEGRYLAFETFLKEGCEKSTSKSIYILRLTGLDKYKVGRSHDVEFHIEDISVSRIHAELQLLANNKIIIKDVKSKFGTQILSKTAKPMDKHDMTNNMYQIGRTWFMAAYESQVVKSGFLCCLCGKPNNTAVPDSKRPKEAEDESHCFLDRHLVTKLENDIENLQKDRDSVFYLDDNFYNKLVHLYIKHDDEESRERKYTSALGAGNETIDDYRRDESKERESYSSSNYVSGEEPSSSGEDEESGVSYSQDSQANREESSIGIGSENKHSNLISKGASIKVKKPL